MKSSLRTLVLLVCSQRRVDSGSSCLSFFCRMAFFLDSEKSIKS